MGSRCAICRHSAPNTVRATGGGRCDFAAAGTSADGEKPRDGYPSALTAKTSGFYDVSFQQNVPFPASLRLLRDGKRAVRKFFRQNSTPQTAVEAGDDVA